MDTDRTKIIAKITLTADEIEIPETMKEETFEEAVMQYLRGLNATKEELNTVMGMTLREIIGRDS